MVKSVALGSKCYLLPPDKENTVCMLQQNQKEINGLFIHFTHYLSSKSLQSILEISTTYRLVSNWLICRLRAQCMISRSNFKLFMISRIIIEVSVLKSCQPWPLNQLISLTTNLIIPNITKTSSSKFCLKLYYQRPSGGLTPGNPRYFHNGTHNKCPTPHTRTIFLH